MKNRFIGLFIGIIISAQVLPIGIGVLAGFSDNSSQNEISSVQPVEIGLKLSESQTEINIYKSKILSASTDVDDTNFIYQWNTSDKDIVSVKKSSENKNECEITANGKGVATLTVNVLDKTKFKIVDSTTCEVTVLNNILTLSHKEATIILSESNTFKVDASGPEGVSVTWYSSDESVATVNDGLITAYKMGNAIITAKAGDLEATLSLKVLNSIFKLEKMKLINKGETNSIQVDGDISEDAVWSSSDSNVVSVNDGSVTGLNKGMATITLTSKELGISSSCIVMVKDGTNDVTELLTGKKADAAQNPGNWYYLCESNNVTTEGIPTFDNGLIHANVLTVGTSGANFFYLRYQPDNVGDVIYKVTLYIYSETTSLLAINGGADTTYNAGLNKIKLDYTSSPMSENSPSQIKFKSAGDYYIIPVFEEISRVEKMTLSETSKTLDLTKESSFKLIATVPNNDNPVISWVSSNASVASVEDGVVTALSKGSSMITATCGSFSATCLVTVIEGEASSGTQLPSGNKSATLASPGQWFYLADGKSSLYSKPTIDENGNISLSIESVDLTNKKYVYLRYQQVENASFKANINIEFAGADGSVIDITGGDQTTATPITVKNGSNNYTFEYTSDNSTPFQMKFYAVGNYVINVSFEKL